MTKLEKRIIWAIVACVLLMVCSVYLLTKEIDRLGGVSGIAVSVGKEVKSVIERVNEDGKKTVSKEYSGDENHTKEMP